MTIVLNNVASANNTSVINANFQKIEDSINDDLLKRQIDSGEANEMRTPLDLNSNKIVNLPDGVDAQDAATFSQMGDNLTLTTAQRVLAETAATDAANTAAALSQLTISQALPTAQDGSDGDTWWVVE